MGISFGNFSGTKPNRVNGRVKDEQYHLDYAQWCTTSGLNHSLHDPWVERTRRNKRFYKNDQWEPEDISVFLNDNSNQPLQRIRMGINQIRPMVEQYRGNSIFLQINASAKNISPFAIRRRDMELEKKFFQTDTATEFPDSGQRIRQVDQTIGRDRGETQRIFENLYVDQYTEAINVLLQNIASRNKFKEEKQMEVAIDLAFSGLAAQEYVSEGSHFQWNTIESEYMILDRSAKKTNFRDSSFVGYWKPMDPAYIAEKWQLEQEVISSMDETVRNVRSQISTSGFNLSYESHLIPVFTMYWIDSDKQEYGYVIDAYGSTRLEPINYVFPGDKEARYTSEDVVDPPDTKRAKILFGNKKSKSIYTQSVRYCKFITVESISGVGGKQKDIALEWGLIPYQEVSLSDPLNSKLPIKMTAWAMVDGDVFSPLDDAIDPQRFVNRVISATEQTINTSGGKGIVIDEDSVEDGMMEEVERNVKNGAPIRVRSRGKGITNTVGNYDTTPGRTAYDMFGIVPVIKSLVDSSTGQNEALRGESTGSDQLVGVTEILLQRGSLMQQPFYYAITNLFLQMYEASATAGKMNYIDNEEELVDFTGDDNGRIIKLSKDMINEDMAVYIEQENDEKALIKSADSMLMSLLQLQLIDDVFFSNMIGRSTPNKLFSELRKYIKLKQESNSIGAEQQENTNKELINQQNQAVQQERADEKQSEALKATVEMRGQSLQHSDVAES